MRQPLESWNRREKTRFGTGICAFHVNLPEFGREY